MSVGSATEVLRKEHGAVMLALRATSREAEAVREGTVREERLGKLVEFCRGFVDACHHGKEERHYFPRLEERGMAVEGGLLGELLEEHVLGRRLIAAIAESLAGAGRGETVARGTLQDNLVAYGAMLREHIRKENEELFPQADRVLTGEDQKELYEAFERLEAEEIGVGQHEHYHALAHELAAAD